MVGATRVSGLAHETSGLVATAHVCLVVRRTVVASAVALDMGEWDAQARTIAAAIVAATMNERAAFFLDDYAVLPYHAESLARLVIF